MDEATPVLCIGVTGGLIALAAALAAASLLGLALRRRAGRFRAPCRPTRQILAQVAGMVDGVTHVDVDAAARLDLARRLRINSTPTVLVLDPDGVVVKRAVGLPRKADVIAALGSVIGPASSGITA